MIAANGVSLLDETIRGLVGGVWWVVAWPLYTKLKAGRVSHDERSLGKAF